MKHLTLALAGSLILTACGGGGGGKSDSSSAIFSSAPSSSQSSTSSYVSSTAGSISSESANLSSSSSEPSQVNCQVIDLSELFACIAGSYPVRHYINRLTSGFIEGLTITDDGVIKVLRNGEWINYRMDDAVEVNDLRQGAEAHLALSFDDEILSLFFTDKGELKDVELQSTDVIWGVSVKPLSVSFNDYKQNPSAMISNGIAGSFNDSSRVNAFYRATPDNESSLEDTQLFLKAYDLTDFWSITINQKEPIDKNIHYHCGVSALKQVVIQMEYQGEHYSSLYGGECVTRITSYEIIQGTDKVDYIDGEAIAVLYTQNHQKSIRSIDTRFRFDVN